ncbi:MAG: hypothetical protein GC155_10740 [Alphaproteobacteria bacterium]|nr:hypothetical protein [Alphaproteobacteria bacterium]
MDIASSSGRTLCIDRRFNGPVASGNGGYAAGLAAQLLAGGERGAEATLRAAIPLDQTLRVQETGNGIDVLTDDASNRILVMSLKPVVLELPIVKSPGLEAASVAAQTFRSADDHVLPTCFVCGPLRAEGDGLRIFPDWTKDPAGVDNPNPFRIVTAPWRPTPDLADRNGRIAPEFLWAALDCPGAFAIEKEPILLGRISVRVLDRPQVNEALVVVAWANGSDRRKHFAGSALFTADGRMVAFSEQTWIQIDAHAHLKPGPAGEHQN